MRPIPQAAIDLIKQFEGLRLQSYLDPAGVWTIGYGHTSHVEPDMFIDETLANTFLLSDLANTAAALSRIAPNVVLDLNDDQYAAILSFVFNIGAAAFATSHVLEYLEKEKYDIAMSELGYWTHDHNGIVLLGLKLRRLAEQQLFTKKG